MDRAKKATEKEKRAFHTLQSKGHLEEKRALAVCAKRDAKRRKEKLTCLRGLQQHCGIFGVHKQIHAGQNEVEEAAK